MAEDNVTPLPVADAEPLEPAEHERMAGALLRPGRV